VPEAEQSTAAAPVVAGPREQPRDEQDAAPGGPGAATPLDALLHVAARDGIAVLDTEAGRVVCLPQARYDALETGSGRSGPVLLTPREVEILSRVARGDGTSAISSDLGVAMNTVAQHLVAVRRKYGVRSSALAVEAARRDGLI